jgi:hypothetical protein
MHPKKKNWGEFFYYLTKHEELLDFFRNVNTINFGVFQNVSKLKKKKVSVTRETQIYKCNSIKTKSHIIVRVVQITSFWD